MATTLGINGSHYIDQMVIRCIAIKHRCFNWAHQFSESHTQSQPIRPLPCVDYHDHNFLTYICSAVVARLLVLACGSANARMQVWNGSVGALGVVGEPAIIVTLIMMLSEHNRFLYYMHEMYQLCWNLTVSPNLISISGPSLLYHGVVFITMTLKHYCVYMLKCCGFDSHRMAGVWSIGFGYGIQNNSYGRLKHVHFISFHLITIWLMKWLLMIPAWPYGVSDQINWLVCDDRGSTNLALNDLHSFDMTESHRYYTTLHFKAMQGSFCARSDNQSLCCIVMQALIGCGHTQNNPCFVVIGILLTEMSR